MGKKKNKNKDISPAFQSYGGSDTQKRDKKTNTTIPTEASTAGMRAWSEEHQQ